MSDSSRIEELRRRVQLDPASIAFAALAEEFRRAGQYDEAIATCEAGLERHPAYVSARVTLGRALIAAGRFADARRELEHVLRLAPENLAAIRGLAEIHRRRGEGTDDAADEHDPAPDQEQAPAPPEPVGRTPISVAPAEEAADKIPGLRHPEEAALPALEALLAAVVNARSTAASSPAGLRAGR